MLQNTPRTFKQLQVQSRQLSLFKIYKPIAIATAKSNNFSVAEVTALSGSYSAYESD